MATREKGRKKTKQEAPQEASQQFKVTDPISMADLENIHMRKGKYPSRPPPFGPKTWELTRKEKEERVSKERRERPLSTPLGTTSTDAMDTEEAQEFSKEITEKVIERELKKQKYEQYQQAKQTSNYQVPKSITIPVPDLSKPRQEKESRPTSVLSNFDVPLYEELMGPKERQSIKHSMSVTPGLSGMKSGEGVRPKDSFNRMSAFQDYTSKMMSALNNPWKPRSRKTATPTWSAVPPLVYVSAAGTPVSDTQSKGETGEKYVPMIFSAVDKTVLTPQGRQEIEGVASPVKFTEALQNGDALKVNPQGGALMEALGFGPDKVEENDPDFYMPDGQGKRLSETYQMFTNEQTPEGNPGVIVKLTNLVKKYGSPFYLMDKKSGHLYVLHEKGYKQIEEKGLLYPSESMIIAGALDENRGNPFVITQTSRLPETPAEESTRVPLKTSTDKREGKEKKEPLTPDGLLEKEQTEWYQKELKEAEEDMVHAYLEKSKLENEEIEIIKQRALKAQEEFEALERKRNENKELHDKMREEIKKMDQAVADSSSFIKKMQDKDPQQIAYEKTISDFWDTLDVPQESAPVKIAPYPSLESLNEEPKEELTEAEHEYYDRKRKILVEKMAIANDVYLAHLQNYGQEDPKDKSQKFLGPVRVNNSPGNGGGGDSSGGTSGDQRFPGEGRGPPRRNGNQKGGGGDDDLDPSDDGDGDDSSSSTDTSVPRKRKHKSPKYVYVLQGPPGPKGQEGQPGQAGRDGRDGQDLSLTKVLEETLKAHKPNLDTTGLENSFDQFGQTIFEVLNAQHRTNQKLEEQFRRANETQEYQVEAMQDMAQANFQMKYDHMFAGVPMYDGTDPDSFDDWLYQIESLCKLSRRDVWVELMGRASAQVKRIIRSLPMDIEWEIAQRELKRCLTEEKSRAHSTFKLAQIKQKPNENLRIFILRYQDLHSAATGKMAAEDTDPTHIIRFLGMMTNSEIARKITQKGIPEGMTLDQAFTRAIELEVGYQLSEGVSLARPPEIMQVQEIEEVDEIAALQKRFKDVVCWGCGEKGHLYRDCPHRHENIHDDECDDSNEYAGKSEQVIRITQPITVATRDNIYKNMATQRTRANLYKAGYRRTKVALQKQQKINAAMSTSLAVQNPTVTTHTVTTTPRVVQPKTVKTQVTQNPNTTTQVVQIPTTSRAPGAGNVPARTGQVRYIRVPAGTTKTAYNLRSTPQLK